VDAGFDSGTVVLFVCMKIKWDKVTPYSRLGSIMFFILVVPILAFNIGVEYEKTQSVLSIAEQIQVSNIPNLKIYKNEKYGFEFKYLANLTYRESLLNGKDLVIDFTDGKPGYNLIITVSPIKDFLLGSGQEPSYYDESAGQLVTYDSVEKKKVVLRERSTLTQNGAEAFYLFSTLVVPNKETGYTISIDESATPEDAMHLDKSPVKGSFRLLGSRGE
jgi:hypothetical protein